MMKDFENIVKDTFEHFEADVNPQAWLNVQQGLKVTPPASHGANGGPTITAGKTMGLFSNMGGIIAIATISLMTIAGTLYYFYNKNLASTKIVISEPVKLIQEPEKNIPAAPAQPITISEKPPVQNKAENKNTLVKKSPAGGFILNDKSETEENLILDVDQKTNRADANNMHVTGNTNSIKQPNNSSEKQTGPVSQTSSNKENQETQVKALIDSYQAQPIAYIMANPVVGNAPLTVHFSNNGYAKKVTWDFGQVTSSENQTEFVFQNPGTYVVKLSAYDADNKLYTDEVSIEVKSAESFSPSAVSEIQNVFTPNGDGYNDLFQVKGSNIASLNAIVFNNSGKQVYSWSDPGAGWDGKLSGGIPAPEGAYYYIIEAKGKDGKVYRFKGSVRLIQ